MLFACAVSIGNGIAEPFEEFEFSGRLLAGVVWLIPEQAPRKKQRKTATTACRPRRLPCPELFPKNLLMMLPYANRQDRCPSTHYGCRWMPGPAEGTMTA
ncbi:hypothetical protein GCM10009569_25330 [Arthrobacter russicus]